MIFLMTFFEKVVLMHDCLVLLNGLDEMRMIWMISRCLFEILLEEEMVFHGSIKWLAVNNVDGIFYFHLFLYLFEVNVILGFDRFQFVHILGKIIEEVCVYLE